MKKFNEKVPGTLEEILQMCFDCKKPFLKQKQVDTIDYDGEKHYRHLTVPGNVAYSRLTDAIYGLELIGVIDNANDIIEELDDIVSSEEY